MTADGNDAISLIKRVSIRTRIYLGFALTLIFLIAVGTFGYTGFVGSTHDVKKYSKTVEEVAHLAKVEANFLKLRNAATFFSLTSSTEASEAVSKYAERVKKEIALAEKGLKTPANIAEMRELKKAFQSYMALYSEFVQINAGKTVTTLQGKEADIFQKMDATAAVLVKDAEHLQEVLTKQEKDIRDETLSIMALAELEMLVAGVLGVAMGVTVSFFISRGISGPISQMTSAMQKLAEGQLDTEVPGLERGDEIGRMAGALQIFKENAIEVRRLNRVSEAEARRGRRQVISQIAALNNALREEVSGAVAEVLKQSEAMEKASANMAGLAGSSSEKSDGVAAAAEEASANVQTVSSAAEEMSASIQEIRRQIQQSTQVAARAVSEADNTNQKMQELAEAADNIGAVVSMITEIAEQTNLLALNATIEAARAGEAGKGFAVVASEVKNLANQTAKATEEIGGQVAGIQNSTKDSVTAIQSIGEIVREMDNISRDIGASIEEQGQATEEISSSVAEASMGTQQVSQLIGEVSAACGEVSNDAETSLQVIGDLRQNIQAMNDHLLEIMEKSQDRRLSDRYTVNVASRVNVDGTEIACLLQEISRSGAAVLDNQSQQLQAGQDFALTCGDLGTINGSVITVTEGHVHIRLELEDVEERLEKLISRSSAAA